MSKMLITLGFIDTEETTPGVWEPRVAERHYYCELLRNSRRRDTPTNINDDLTISNELSILADPYALNHFHSLQYVKMFNASWKVTNIEVQYPRLTLTTGGVYNGKQA